jgi:hypothetical protein
MKREQSVTPDVTNRGLRIMDDLNFLDVRVSPEPTNPPAD